MSKKFNLEIDRFIDVVKEFPVVYSRVTNLSGAAHQNEKALAWIDIAKKLSEDDPNKLKQKWRNLRDSYHKAMRYKKDLEEVGQLAKYHEYRHESKLSFLLPHILPDIPRKKRHKVVEDDSEYCKPEKIEKKDILNYSIESQEVEYLVDELSYSEIKRSEDEEILYKDSQEEEVEQLNSSEHLETDSNICFEEVDANAEENLPEQQPSVVDELDVWISSVKASMLKLTKLNRARAKRDINTVLSNYEIEQYEAEDE